jgi:hypothetical protein
LPDLQALAAENAGCLAVVGVTLDSSGADVVSSFARARAIAYPLLIGNPQVAADYGLTTIPLSILVDAQGREAERWDGPVSRKEVRTAIRALDAASPNC